MAAKSKKIRKTSLAEDVCALAGDLENVLCVFTGGVRKKGHGERRVKVPTRWSGSPAAVPFTVFDGENGERDVIVRTTKAGAITRIVGKRLKAQGVRVC